MNIQKENPTVKLVTPVAQAIEIAKSELERVRDSPKKKKTYERHKNYLKDKAVNPSYILTITWYFKMYFPV